MKIFWIILGCMVACALVIVTISGCTRGHVVDGPGMINPASWEWITVSRSDSYAQHNFYIKITQHNDGYIATGEVRGDDGELYIEESGILLSAKAAKKIDALNPVNLPDVPQSTEGNSGGSEDVFVLDQAVTKIEVFYTDGRLSEKADADDFSIELYQIVMPCFADNYK